MAHWAELDENNIVLRVLVGDNNDPDEGYQWLIDNLGGRWIKTSYNTREGIHIEGGTPLRYRFAGIGMIYNEEKDVFLYPKPNETYVLNQNNFLWEPPILT